VICQDRLWLPSVTLYEGHPGLAIEQGTAMAEHYWLAVHVDHWCVRVMPSYQLVDVALGR
jgi:hypothetical protein